MPVRRERLPGLTPRGRALAAAGLTVLLCSAVLGIPQLVRVGVLLLALPALAWVFIGVRRRQVSATRLVAQPVVAAGTTCGIELIVSGGRRRGETLAGEETLPFALGDRPRFVIDSNEPAERITYDVRSEVRGRFALGPLRTRTSDPFGLVEVRATVPGTAAITVTPPIVPLPVISLGSGRSGTGERQSPAVAAGSAEDVTVREYRRGDDLRRIHWRSSARVGDLMVRREEHPWEARVTVLLDNRASAHRGHGRGSSLESAVTVAASIAVHLDRHGYAVRLVTADGSATSGTESVLPLLEHLAVVGLSPRTDLPVAGITGPQGHGTVIGVFGLLEGTDSRPLRSLRRQTDNAVAVALDAYRWEHRNAAPSEANSLVLRELGWRSATLGPADRIEQVWQSVTSRDGGRR